MDNDPGAPRTYEQVVRIGYGLASELFGPDVVDEEEALQAQENFASPPIDFFLEAGFSASTHLLALRNELSK